MHFCITSVVSSKWKQQKVTLPLFGEVSVFCGGFGCKHHNCHFLVRNTEGITFFDWPRHYFAEENRRLLIPFLGMIAGSSGRRDMHIGSFVVQKNKVKKQKQGSWISRIRTGIGASSVRLAPPSYSCLDVSSLPGVNTGNTHNQYSRRTEGNTSFRDYGGEVSSTFKRRPCSRSSDDYATSSSTCNIAFTGLQFANDGRSLLFGGANRSDIISTGSHSSKRNDFHYQESAAPMFPTLNIESYARNSPLPPLPDFEDHLEEPSLPPLPEFYAKNSLVGLETEENKFTNFIPRQETNFGTTLTEGINSFSSGHTGTSLDQQNSLEVLASEILENIEKEQIFNHTVTSLPPSTTPWSTNTNMASNPLINQDEYSLPPLPSEVPWDLYPDLIPAFMDQENSPLPSSFHDNLW